VDIEGSTNRPNPIKARLRDAMYELLERALRAGGLTDRDHDPLVDRGDGVLALIHPIDQAPKTLLLNTVVPNLAALLTQHNNYHLHLRFRLRTVVHAGEIHYDDRGCFGEALDVAIRLLDAPEVKQSLCLTTTPLVLVVSDDIYRSVVRHNYDGIDGQAFEPLVRLQIGDWQYRGWIHIPESISGGDLRQQATGSLVRLDSYKRRA